jgi:16S rRNA (guanine966-N2)-methyltransferase
MSTRIIGGEAGGRRIKTPPGDGTRPTSDRVREALFSAVDAALGSLHGVRFLDLYAGSGAVGLEARSRGADVVTLVEHDRRTARLIRENVERLGIAREGGRVEVVVSTVARALGGSPSAPYDVVFADPPYKLAATQVEADLRALIERAWLSPGALVVVERPTRDDGLTWPTGLTGERSRRYGETTLWYGHATA